MNTICFYRTNEAYGEFSNFSRHPFTLKGREWSTSEHYFQAQKFSGTSHEETIRKASTAAEAAKLGRSRAFPLRADWEQVKEEVMAEALRAKFTQHANLRSLLLATRDSPLVEHTTNDAYWADGGDGHGLNRLGILLMRLRDELRNELKA